MQPLLTDVHEHSWLKLRHVTSSNINPFTSSVTAIIRAKLASCLINAQPLPAHRPAADDWQMIGRCPVTRAMPMPILLTADAHLGARFGAFLY